MPGEVREPMTIVCFFSTISNCILNITSVSTGKWSSHPLTKDVSFATYGDYYKSETGQNSENK